MRCIYCQNWEISQVSPRESRNIDMMPDRVVEECVSGRCASIAYTYSEPTVFFEYMCDIADRAREAGLKSVVVTSGYIAEEPIH